MTAPPPITAFVGPYRFLSNFWPCRVTLDGETYPTVEHAYQAAKTLEPRRRHLIRVAPTPGHATRAGRALSLRPDWHAIKYAVMLALLVEKFADPDLRRQLLATAPRRLVEGNHWGDTHWGVYRGRGDNHLGRLLMVVRDGDVPTPEA